MLQSPFHEAVTIGLANTIAKLVSLTEIIDLDLDLEALSKHFLRERSHRSNKQHGGLVCSKAEISLIDVDRQRCRHDARHRRTQENL
jgi:hypothetical protein